MTAWTQPARLPAATEIAALVVSPPPLPGDDPDPRRPAHFGSDGIGHPGHGLVRDFRMDDHRRAQRFPKLRKHHERA